MRRVGRSRSPLARPGLIVSRSSLGASPTTSARQYDTFVHPGSPQRPVASTRLVSRAGHRYDYWRIAWADFEARPWTAWRRPVRRLYFGPGHGRERPAPAGVQLQVLAETGHRGRPRLAGLRHRVYLGAYQRAFRRGSASLGEPWWSCAGRLHGLVHPEQQRLNVVDAGMTMAFCCATVLTGSKGRADRPRRLSPAWSPVASVLAVFARTGWARPRSRAPPARCGSAIGNDPSGAARRSRVTCFDGASSTTTSSPTAYERLGELPRPPAAGLL